jgi:hypothetical protein
LMYTDTLLFSFQATRPRARYAKTQREPLQFLAARPCAYIHCRQPLIDGSWFFIMAVFFLGVKGC